MVSLGDVLAEPPSPFLSFGLKQLDEMAAGLLAPRLTVIAGAPDAGGGLLAATLARRAALQDGQKVLYGVSGLTSKDVAERMVAAEAGVNYPQLRSGSLPREQQAREREARERLSSSLLWFDDGAGDPLTVDMIAETARYADGLALIVVDRFQHRAQAGVPLSGRALAAAAERLAQLAADLTVPVVTVLDTDDTQTAVSLHPHLTLTLTRSGTQAHVVVKEADAGEVATVPLLADLPRLRFTDQPEDAHTAAPEQARATPPAGERGRSTSRASGQPVPPAAETETATVQATEAAAAPRPPVPALPGESGESQVQRLARRASEQVKDEDHEVLDLLTAKIEDHLREAQGDLDTAAARMVGKAIEDVMDLFQRSRVYARREHSAKPPSYDFLKKKTKRGTDQVWEGRQTWVNTGLLEDIKAGSPASVDATVLDVPGAYLNSLNVWLPQGQLRHKQHNPDDLRDGFPGPRHASGIFLAEPPAWEHPHLPNPLGGRREPGPLLLDTATVKLLVACHEKHGLCGPPRIFESWTSSGSETFLLKLRRVLDAVRLAAIEEDVVFVQKYVKTMYSRFASTMGESITNLKIKRPEWMHSVRSQAFANLWLRAYKLYDEAGLTIVKALGTDEIHITGDTDWRTVYEEGQRLSQMKTKPGYTITSRNVHRHFPKD
ncbi:DnaB-like helicase C-terminal domain-containing protein [Streptomyces botrytidirepellens]|nr:DnaB-like helicase C-terminal domain-containing protein [Streptomyces botrytidirepellens]